MLKKEMNKAINEQIVKELYSAYLYLQMAGWFDGKTLPGFANWMKVQAQEEMSHAMIFYNYVVAANGSVELGEIAKPPFKFSSALDIFEQTLAHEVTVTASIGSLMDLAQKLHDYATISRLNWFIDEQVEEESNANDLIGKLKIVGEKGDAIYLLDRELAARTFTPPAPLAGADAGAGA